MKKILFLSLAIATLASCQKDRYTQQSAEIDTYKKVIAAYEKRQFDDMLQYYADTAKILNNVTKESAQTLAEFNAQNKKDAELFVSWAYADKESEYEMVTTDNGETWVNFFGQWEGTIKATGKKHVIPTFITARFIDGKIVRELGYWDNSKIAADLAAAETAIEKPVQPKDSVQ